MMAENGQEPAAPGVDAALGRLLGAETWADYFSRHSSDGWQLGERAPRFRAALSGLGYSYSVAEVRAALLERAGLEEPARAAADNTSGGYAGVDTGVAWDTRWAADIASKTFSYVSKYDPSCSEAVSRELAEMQAAQDEGDPGAYERAARRACIEARKAHEAGAAALANSGEDEDGWPPIEGKCRHRREGGCLLCRKLAAGG